MTPDLSNALQRLNRASGMLGKACDDFRQIASEIQGIIVPALVDDVLAYLDSLAAQDSKKPQASPTEEAADVAHHLNIDQAGPRFDPSVCDHAATPAAAVGSEEPPMDRNHPPKAEDRSNV